MKSLIIYDSNYGNTKQLAEAMADVLGASAVSVKTATAEMLKGVELLLVGSPINGWRPTEATGQFLASLPAGSLRGVRVAAFDTRISLIIHGDAAKKIARELARAGATEAAPPEPFYVKGTKEPLKDGELERSRAWAKAVGG